MKYVVVLTTEEVKELEFHSRLGNNLFLKDRKTDEDFVKYRKGHIKKLVDRNVCEIENYDSEYLICDCGEEINMQEERYFECYIDDYNYCSLNCCINALIDDEYIFVDESGEYLFNKKYYKNKEDLLGIIGDYI